YGDSEGFERAHLPVEPAECVRPKTVGPAQASAEIGDAQIFHDPYRVVEPMILEMKPLAQSHIWCVLVEMPESRFGRAVFPQQTHIEMAVVGRTFRLAVASRGGPGSGQIVETVPVN